MSIDFLLANKEERTFGKKALSKEDIQIADQNYLDFINDTNGGFFFNNALLVYPFLEEDLYPSMPLINQTLKSLYGGLFNNLVSFGQDIFGNQFCFCTENETVVFFNIEDAGKTYLAKDFKEWIDVFTNDYDYYAGVTYVDQWLESNELKANERLCPKYPFVIGGDFKLGNFYASAFPKYLEVNADIAKQIYDLPNGTKVAFKVKK